MRSKHAISVTLTEHLNALLRTKIAAGRYRTASEGVRHRPSPVFTPEL